MDVQELARAAQNLSFEQRKELIKTLIAQLPTPESVADSGEQTNGLPSPTQHNPNFSPNQKWLEEHRVEYAGYWVALHDGKLIAHSTDGESLVAPVRKAGVRNPMIVFVEPPGTELFVGF